MKNILLVFGGKSYEHDISVVTAAQIYNKTRLDSDSLVPLYISRDNKFYVYRPKKMDIKDFSRSSFNSKGKNFVEVEFVSGVKNTLFAKTMFGLKEFMTADTAIIACHGGLGENGKLVAFLEMMGISSSSGSSTALGISMNKFLFKQVMKGLDIPTVRGIRVTKTDYEKRREEIEFKLRFLKFPVVIKQNNGGSSIGLFVAENIDEFHSKMQDAFEFDDEILIERYIANTREFNVALIGTSDDFIVSEIDEPLKQSEILSFADKYLSGGGKGKKVNTGKNSMASQVRKLPADISDELERKIKKFASKIFENLGLTGVVRIDFLYDEANNKLYVCEVNAVPGSLSYYFFKENNIHMNNLVKRLDKIAEKNKEIFFNGDFCTKILD